MTFSPTTTEYGPLILVARGYFDAGREPGVLTACVRRGESVANSPFQPTTGVKILLNHDVAERSGVAFSPELIAVSSQNGH